MITALKFFMDEVGKATREGHTVDAVEAEHLDSGEVQIVALSPDASVLSVTTLEPQETDLAEIEELAGFLVALVVECEEALSGGLVKIN